MHTCFFLADAVVATSVAPAPASTHSTFGNLSLLSFIRDRSLGYPDRASSGILCFPDGYATAHGAGVPGRGASSGGRGFLHLPGLAEAERPRGAGEFVFFRGAGDGVSPYQSHV